MSFEQECAELEAQVLVEKFDEMLVRTWFQDPGCKVRELVINFAKQYNLTVDETFKLPRTPKAGHHYNSTVVRFCAAYLPKLSERLWLAHDRYLAPGADKAAIITGIAEWLKRQRFRPSIQNCDIKKTRRERYEHQKAIKEAFAENVSATLVAEQRKRHSWYNWENHK